MNKSLGFKLAGAAALAGSSQAYGQIVPITGNALPSNLTATRGGSTTEYYTIGGGTSSTPGGDLKIDLFEDNFGHFSIDALPVQTTDATTGFSFAFNYYGPVTYGSSSPIAAGAKVGTGSADTPTFITVTPGYPFYINAFAQPANTPDFIGFQFTDPTGEPGNIHDGYLELEVLTATATNPAELTFLGGAYNSTPDDGEGGGNITVEAIPEPGTISSLALGAAALGGVGLLRRRRSMLA